MGACVVCRERSVAEVVARVAPHGMDVIRPVLHVVVFNQEAWSLHAVVVATPGRLLDWPGPGEVDGRELLFDRSPFNFREVVWHSQDVLAEKRGESVALSFRHGRRRETGRACHAIAKRLEVFRAEKRVLRRLSAVALLMSLAACNKTANEVAADNIEANVDNTADNVDAMADNATGATADNLGNQADALRDKGDNVADNVAAGAMNEAQGNKAVNAM